MWRWFIPDRYQPHVDRILVGAIIGLLGFGLGARLAFQWVLHGNVGYATFPAALIGLIVGPIIAWRTRRR
jgi:uncharacterized RDD family membrane protein YckC